MKIYISLPISGKDIEEVKLKAREAAVLLEEDGHVPITPFEVSPQPMQNIWVKTYKHYWNVMQLCSFRVGMIAKDVWQSLR